jgi:hypothetical protein
MKSPGLLSMLFISVLGCMAGYGAAQATETVTTEPAESKDESPLILTFGASPVYAAEFRYWLGYLEKYHQASHGDETADGRATWNGLPLRDYLLASATEQLCNDRAVTAKAAELGIHLSDVQEAALQAEQQQNLRIYGSESEYQRIVASMYVSQAVFDHLRRMKLLGDNLFERLYGARGEQCSAECVSAYVEPEHFMAAQYIFKARKDRTGQALSAAQLKQNDRLLRNILRQLDASKDSAALFAQLMHAHSDDPSLANYPDGRLFASGSKSPTFEQTYQQLTEHQYSRIVHDSDGDYLILRLPIFPDMVADTEGHTLRYWAAYQYQFRNQVSNWCAQLPIRYEAAYYRMLE